MLYLLETPVGMALFKNEGTTSFISALKYENCNEAKDFIDKLAVGDIPEKISEFLKKYLITTTSLNISNPELSSKMSKTFGIHCKSEIDDIFRSLKVNSFKYFGFSKNSFNSFTVRLAHKLINSKAEDLVLIDLLNLIEEMDLSINNRMMRIREWYSLHFPELNQITDNTKYLELLVLIKNREDKETRDLKDVPGNIKRLMQNSMGSDLKSDDISKIVEDAKSILGDMVYRSNRQKLLKSKCREHFPNLSALIDEVLVVKLLRKAGSIAQLSQQPSSNIQIYGAEKAFNLAIKEKGNTPKYGFIFDSTLLSTSSDRIRGKVARVLANKIALCSKVDAAGESKTGDFGAKLRETIERIIYSLEDRVKLTTSINKTKRKVVEVEQYDLKQDSKRSKH